MKRKANIKFLILIKSKEHDKNEKCRDRVHKGVMQDIRSNQKFRVKQIKSISEP